MDEVEEDWNREEERGRRERLHSQLHHDGPRLDLVHFHKGETLCAGELLLGFVVLELKEDSCSWKNATLVTLSAAAVGCRLGDAAAAWQRRARGDPGGQDCPRHL